MLASGPTQNPESQPASLPTQADMSSPALSRVHVSGWVNSPGVVQLPPGAIVADAIEAAGGFRPGADTSSMNLALEVTHGEQVVVAGPVDGAAPVGDDGGDPGQISLNRASAEDLERLPGVGPVLAQRIVAHREKVGRFERVEDLLNVSGIGEAKLATIRELVRP